MINCKHCGAQHYTVKEVRDCAGLPPTTPSPDRPPKGRVRAATRETCPCRNPDCQLPPEPSYDEHTDTFTVSASWFDHHVKKRHDPDEARYHRPPDELAAQVHDWRDQL